MASRTFVGLTYSNVFTRPPGPCQRTLSLQHRLSDPLVGSAAAEISAHPFAHALRIAAGLTFLDQTNRAHDLSRRTEAALQTVVGKKGFLHRVKSIAQRHAFNGKD